MKALGKSLLVLVMMITVSSCATSGQRSSSHQKPEQYSQKITEARLLHEHGEVDAAVSVLQTWVDGTPYEVAHDPAYELIVEWLLQLNRHAEAKRVASYFLSRHRLSPSAARIIQLFDNTKPESTSSETSAVPELLEENEGGDNPMDSVLDKDTSVFNDTEDKNYILFEAPVSAALTLVKKNSSALVPRAHARLANYYFHLGDFVKSAEHISLASGVPADVSAVLTALTSEIDALGQVNAKSIGVLLPLTGPFAAFGKKALTAMSIALEMKFDDVDGIATFMKDDISIVVGDSKGETRETERVLEQLVKVNKVAVVVGDITNDPSLLAAQKCQQYGVPMLSLSRHPSVSELGEFVFMVNASPKQQIERLVDHAMNKEGHKRFAILYPKHNYGMSMSRLFFDEVIKRGGSITGLEPYDVHETTFATPIKKLVGKHYLSLRPEAAACARSAQNVSKCQNSIAPIVDFEALFIPEFQKLALVIPGLQQEDVLISSSPRAKASLAAATKIANPSYVQLLGANSWHDKAVLSKISSSVEGAFFVDSFSFDESAKLKEFQTAFTASNGQAPTSLEVYAHDAARLAWKLLSGTTAVTSRKDLRDRIAAFRGQIGLLDNLSFFESGELDAPEVGFKIVNGSVEVVPSGA